MSGTQKIQDETVITLIQQGKANKEIATYLRTTEQSIKDKVHKLLRKYNCKNRTELAMKFGNVA